MRTLPWNRSQVIGELRDRIWRYLTPAADPEAFQLQASALFDLTPAEMTRLGNLHFVLSDEVKDLLARLPQLLRSLNTTSVNEEELSRERIRGSIQWTKTFAARAVTGTPNVYVTAPARRAYQTPENQLLRYVLSATVDAGVGTGWDQSDTKTVGTEVAGRTDSAESYLRRRVFSDISREIPRPRDLSRIRTGRYKTRYSTVIKAFDRYQDLVRRRDISRLQQVVEEVALLTRDNGRLFELLILFRLLEALRDQGWSMSPIGLFQGVLRATGARDDQQIAIYFQDLPRRIGATVYDRVLRDHGVLRQPLRPDFFLVCGNRLTLIETKLRATGVETAARAALHDLLAYREAFRDYLDNTPSPYGIGISWGEGLTPYRESEVLLCTPDSLGAAIASTLDK